MSDTETTESSPSEVEVITLSDDESTDQKPAKVEKKEVQERPSLLAIVDWQQKLEESDRRGQQLSTIADERQARIDDLESQIVTVKREAKEAEELGMKKVNDLTAQMENERRRATEEKQMDHVRVIELSFKLAQSENLVLQLQEKGSLFEKKLVELNKRNIELSLNLAQSENLRRELQEKGTQAEKMLDGLKKGMVDFSTQLEEERRKANEDRNRANEERQREMEERVRDQGRIATLTAQVEEFEKQQLHLIRVLRGEMRSTEMAELDLFDNINATVEHEQPQEEAIVEGGSGSEGGPSLSGGEEAGAPMISTQKESIERCLASLEHAVECGDKDCGRTGCYNMKKVIAHCRVCEKRVNGSCPVCKQLIAVCCVHREKCEKEGCRVPFCASIRQKKEEKEKEKKEKLEKEKKKELEKEKNKTPMKRERRTSSDDHEADGDSTVANSGYKKKISRHD